MPLAVDAFTVESLETSAGTGGSLALLSFHVFTSPMPRMKFFWQV